ncbi:MAG: S1/P1 Nuclease [Bacteroidetes bacterium]|nr:S1/P1 Nuclease [Bacteroidota bacterium]MBL0139803.1 S1/P1 Nuclease [Bacteroidota bacterium]
MIWLRNFILFLFFTQVSPNASGWGFYGHRKINYMACFTLPPDLFGFYKEHIDFLTEHAVDPDKRRYSDKEEPPRHYIDIDHYGEHPFDSVPMYWKTAVEKFTEDTLKAYGIVPWHIHSMMFRLTEAFRAKDVDRILYYSANIGHYIGDAHVPLHCTENYNGQMTNQTGIHGFWESRLPELYGDQYDYLLGRAEYVEHIQEDIWRFVKDSFNALDSVLLFERILSRDFSTDRKYAIENRGATTVKVYSEEYSGEFHKQLDGQVERRLRAAILDVGSLWYTAWINAGSPDLVTERNKEISDSLKQQLSGELLNTEITKNVREE